MYNSPRETSIFGQKIVFYSECPSTNTEAIRFTETNGIIHGSVFICDHQSFGRGQVGNHWFSEKGKNLTFSIVVEDPVPAEKQFYLNIFLSLALVSKLRQLTGLQIQVKWPNDIMIEGLKLGGLLIENAILGKRIRFSVLGIGLNVNQIKFTGLRATSLANQTGITYDLNQLFAELLISIEKHYQLLKNSAFTQLKSEWLKLLYLRGKVHRFSSGGNFFDGTIKDIDEYGRLLVKVDGSLKSFNFKEIIF